MKLRTVNMTEPLKDIKTNIITGFLGVGKSTAILDLLEQKPEKERWAVLVNEFGEIGIDGGLFANHQDPNIFIREVPGGCMCCATGLPMQIAMSMLLARARPERLIIEPTGLGHPVEVMSVLAADHFHELLDLRSTLTLVDARVINDERYTSHDTFNQQLDIAAVSMGNPHAVMRAEDVDNAPVHQLGPKIEHHSRFPQRVNAGFIQVVDRQHAKLRVWERGAGETQACGTGACAAAVAAIQQGWMDSPVQLDLLGGRLSIEWAGAGHPVMMTGPAVRVFEGQVRL